jgi:hypothetical protein
MGQFVTGILFIVFGLIIGGVGVATAGVGIGIPMIPLGIYMLFRGAHTLKNEKEMEEIEVYTKQESFETTTFGKFALGIILILIGIATSALLIGIPLIIFGIISIVFAFKSKT